MIETRTAEINIEKNNNNVFVTKKFFNTLKQNDIHRRGPRNCFCGKPLIELLKNETNILNKLKNEKHFPKLINIDENNYSYSMTYCGETLLKLIKNKNLKIPIDYKIQIENIAKALDKINLYHNDIALANICILDGIIYLIDFGCWQPLDKKIEENYDNRNNLIDLQNIFEKIK